MHRPTAAVTQSDKDRELLTGYTISSASCAKTTLHQNRISQQFIETFKDNEHIDKETVNY